MTVTIRVNGDLRKLLDGQSRVEVSGNTTGECLANLEHSFPDIGKEIRNSKGEVSDEYLIYVNGKSAYPEELTTPVRDNDEIEIAYILDGG